MIFDTRKTAAYKALKLWSFPLCRYAGALSRFFLLLLIVALFLAAILPALMWVSSPFIAGSFFDSIPLALEAKIIAFFLFFFLFFMELSLFVEFWVKKTSPSVSLNDAVKNPGKQNLAEFLSLQAMAIIEDAIKLSKKRKMLGVSPEFVFYSCLRQSRDIQTLALRLGMDWRKLQQELKNYLEKQAKQEKYNLSISANFERLIEASALLAVKNGHQIISEKEIFIALAKHSEFFKKVLIEQDLKEEDVENIARWFGALQEAQILDKKFWRKENLAKAGSLGRDFASGFTVSLDQFSIDWTKFSRQNAHREVIGHAKEIDDVQTVLAKSHLSNALIVGDVGSGRKSIVQAIAKKCQAGESFPELNYKRVVQLDMVSLLARVQDPEKVEMLLDRIFSEALSAGNVILAIDALENFVEQDKAMPGKIDISGILVAYLMKPEFHFIGICSFDGLHTKLEKNPSFLEYFRKIEVAGVSEADTTMILQNLAMDFEYKHNVFITYPAIREIIHLTAKYFPSTPFPKKAIDTLEEAVEHIKHAKDFSVGIKQGLDKKLVGSKKVLLPHHIAYIISDKAQIPIGKMDFKEKEVLLNLENLIHQRIVNQKEAVSEISIAMRRARSGLASSKRPMGTFLFLGPTGVGKTETAKALAQIYFGSAADGNSGRAGNSRVSPKDSSSAGSSGVSEEKMIRLDMSEFQEVSDIQRLLGDKDQPGLLTTPVRENPFSLVLLDEIEKAHPNILNIFLQVLDEGHITDGQGRKVMFTNTIIICTSNAGAAKIFKEVETGNNLTASSLFAFLIQEGTFRPEFINRFDAAVLFHPLTRENLMDIAQLMLSSLEKTLKEKDIEFFISEALKAKIVELSYKPEFGARQMRRTMQDKVENPVAEALLSDKIKKGDKIEINPETFEVIKIA